MSLTDRAFLTQEPIDEVIGNSLRFKGRELLLELDFESNGTFRTQIDSQLFDARLLQLQKYVLVDSAENVPFYLLKVDQLDTLQRSNMNHTDKFILWNGPDSKRVTTVVGGGPTDGDDYVFGEQKDEAKMRWRKGRHTTLTGTIQLPDGSAALLPRRVWLLFSFWKHDLSDGYRI